MRWRRKREFIFILQKDYASEQVSVSIPKNWIEEAGIQLPFPSKKCQDIVGYVMWLHVSIQGKMEPEKGWMKIIGKEESYKLVNNKTLCASTKSTTRTI